MKRKNQRKLTKIAKLESKNCEFVETMHTLHSCVHLLRLVLTFVTSQCVR